MRTATTGGRFIYVMGASGAGKDAVMADARRQLGAADRVMFSHRYITRPAERGHENYVALSVAEFRLRQEREFFLFNWAAHGLEYGIGIEADLWRRDGIDVVISGSRAHFATLATTAHIQPVLIDAPAELLRRRLVARGREDAAAIEARLTRGAALRPTHPDLVTIANAGDLAVASAQFLATLRD
jgi:ribose 1,5-bisphosphokinase